ncbi:MAG: tetratricopeptide repeat protein [Pyrinomonadaceae bacterium]|nr:tetratricopeptide repeat protein [Pyrinomonadaceae bacterium]
MRNLVLVILLLTISVTLYPQDSSNTVAKKDDSTSEKDTKLGDDKSEFKNATSQPTAEDRILALKKFIDDFPESDMKIRAQEIIVSSRAEIADEKLRLGENEAGIELFKLAVKEAPEPVSEKVFSGLLAKFPLNLFWRGQRAAAFEVAKMVEDKVGENTNQLLGLTNFYLGVEDSSGAKRLAEKVLELDSDSADAYLKIGLAERISFDLEKSAEAYGKALELNPDSINAKNNLAQMKRALGQPDQAAALYREILEIDAANSVAQTGLALSLFDAGNRAEAEAEMAKSLEQNPKNLTLLVGAAYWYAAQGDGDEAVKHAQKALEIEPRYTWTYIALSRGYLQQGYPDAAERVLIVAKKYGNFPTLDYELASARMASGFFKEAAEDLRKSFTVENGVIKTKLGGRVEKEADSFIELLSLERRASIFQVTAADNNIDSKRLKHLLDLDQKIKSEDIEEAGIVSAANSFIDGDDKMKTHRQLFVANELLENNKALPAVLDITKDSVKGVDTALDIISPSAAVLADELYQSRKIAFTRGQTVVVPDIPRNTLSRIIRGRIEEISGWALFNQERPDEALVKLKTAISILPKDSAWWRSSNWRLGTVLESQNKSEDALNAYIEGYLEDEQNTAKKLVIENLYAKINGSLEGLDERLRNKESASNTATIFKAKPIEEETKPAETTENESGSVTGDENASTDLTKIRIPKAVPIARATPKPAATPEVVDPIKLKSDEIKANSITNEEIIKVSTAAAVTRSDTETTSKSASETILIPDSNITKLPEMADENTKKPNGKNIETNTEKPENEKPLFDPIVISVPKPETKDLTKTKSPDAAKTDTGKPKKIDSNGTNIEDISEAINAVKPVKIEDEPVKNSEENSLVDQGRPRIVGNDTAAVKPGEEKTEPEKCEIVFSQDTVSIINGGGSLGLLIAIEEGKGDPQTITAKSRSPKDVEAVHEPEIGALSGRAFFVIKSISGNKGVYTVTFKTPCGDKDLVVNVR